MTKAGFLHTRFVEPMTLPSKINGWKLSAVKHAEIFYI